jgi:hypothetical protein
MLSTFWTDHQSSFLVVILLSVNLARKESINAWNVGLPYLSKAMSLKDPTDRTQISLRLALHQLLGCPDFDKTTLFRE